MAAQMLRGAPQAETGDAELGESATERCWRVWKEARL